MCNSAGDSSISTYAFGEDDGVIISEAPDDVTAATVILAAVGAGHGNAVQTVPLRTAQQAVEAMRKAGSVRYAALGHSAD